MAGLRAGAQSRILVKRGGVQIAHGTPPALNSAICAELRSRYSCLERREPRVGPAPYDPPHQHVFLPCAQAPSARSLTCQSSRFPSDRAVSWSWKIGQGVKVYPSTGYRDPMRATERKPTSPTNQAQHWYSHALLKVMRLQSKHPDAIVAIGLPDFPRYRKLVEETQGGLKKLGIGLLTVSEKGEVAASDIPKHGTLDA